MARLALKSPLENASGQKNSEPASEQPLGKQTAPVKALPGKSPWNR
jgi:hypothetical protein